MLRYLIRLGLKSVIAFSVLIVVTALIGSFRDYPAAEIVQQFDCSPKPCWHGIHVGVTTVEEAFALLSSDETIRIVEYDPAEPRLCWIWLNEWHTPYRDWDPCYAATIPEAGLVLSLGFDRISPLRFGDVLPIMGKPLSSTLICIESIPGGLIFNESMRLTLFDPNDMRRITPELSVHAIVAFAPMQEMRNQPNMVYRWTGFSRWANIEEDCPR